MISEKIIREIWNAIPVEFLRPERRVVADLTVGKSLFLETGCERLSRVSDARAVKIRPFHRAQPRPNIVIGYCPNPPFEQIRQIIGGLADGGYFALVMRSEGRRDLPDDIKTYVARETDPMELWYLFDELADDHIFFLAQKRQRIIGENLMFRCRMFSGDCAMSNAIDIETWRKSDSIFNRQTTDNMFSASPNPNATWQTTGVVEVVYTCNRSMRVFLRSFDDLQIVKITPIMPGWLLRKDAGFCVKMPREYISRRELDNYVWWGDFHPLEYTYLSELELLEELSKITVCQ